MLALFGVLVVNTVPANAEEVHLAPPPAEGAAPLSGNMLRPGTTGYASLGRGMIDTATGLTHALSDGVKNTVVGTASLARSVTGSVRDTLGHSVGVARQVGTIVGATVGDRDGAGTGPGQGRHREGTHRTGADHQRRPPGQPCHGEPGKDAKMRDL